MSQQAEDEIVYEHWSEVFELSTSDRLRIDVTVKALDPTKGDDIGARGYRGSASSNKGDSSAIR